MSDKDLFPQFYTDKNVGPGDYKHFDKDTLWVSKIFDTIQGEGPFAGTPATFIRLAGCNRGDKKTMGCQFCDTDFRFGMGTEMTFRAIIKNCNKNLVVITGGEPMIQNNLTDFLYKYCMNWEMQIESNGDRFAKLFIPHLRLNNVTLVISPKVTKGKYKPLKPEILKRANYLKFLIDSRPESPYYNPPHWNYPADQIYLSPITVYKHQPPSPVSMWDQSFIDHEATSLNYRRAAQLAMEYDYRVSLQTHLFLGLE